jgi:branched-chain amino acid transport system substrate-binding protein
MDKWFPEGNKADTLALSGYALAETMVRVLRQCGDDLTRANVMKQAANLRDFEPAGLLPGIKINTSATDFYPIEQLQMMRFKGESWELFGPVIDGEVGG